MSLQNYHLGRPTRRGWVALVDLILHLCLFENLPFTKLQTFLSSLFVRLQELRTTTPNVRVPEGMSKN